MYVLVPTTLPTRTPRVVGAVQGTQEQSNVALEVGMLVSRTIGIWQMDPGQNDGLMGGNDPGARRTSTTMNVLNRSHRAGRYS